MTIKQILELPVGETFTDFDVAIKTCKKIWQWAANRWVQQVVISDSTGDALVDVNIGGYVPLQRNSTLHIIRGVIQPGVQEVGKKTNNRIYIERFNQPSDIGEPENDITAISDKITRSKIKHGLVCAYVKSGREPDKSKILELVEFIFN